jgi:hypothetical protein
MLLLSESTPDDLGIRLRDANAMTVELMSDIIRNCCRRFPSHGHSGRKECLEELIRLGAWTDAALALLDLELPQWQVRRLAYDNGEWYCALSRRREMPDWLDESIETNHTELSLAILNALVEAQRMTAPSSRPSVPTVAPRTDIFYKPVLTDNFA